MPWCGFCLCENPKDDLFVRRIRWQWKKMKYEIIHYIQVVFLSWMLELVSPWFRIIWPHTCIAVRQLYNLYRIIIIRGKLKPMKKPQKCKFNSNNRPKLLIGFVHGTINDVQNDIVRMRAWNTIFIILCESKHLFYFWFSISNEKRFHRPLHTTVQIFDVWKTSVISFYFI